MTDPTDGRHRRITLTPRMHGVLLDVLDFACEEHPGDVDSRKLRNIVKAAKRVDPCDDSDRDTVPPATPTGLNPTAEARSGTSAQIAAMVAELRKLEGFTCSQ